MPMGGTWDRPSPSASRIRSAPSCQTAASARTRLRFAGALLFGAGAITMAAVLGAPDPDPSDHPALSVRALAYAVITALLVLWRRPPSAALHAICPAGTLAATAAGGVGTAHAM